MLQLTLEKESNGRIELVTELAEEEVAVAEIRSLQQGWFGTSFSAAAPAAPNVNGSSDGVSQDDAATRQLSVHRPSPSTTVVASFDAASAQLDIYDPRSGKHPIFRHRLPSGTKAFCITESLIFAAHASFSADTSSSENSSLCDLVSVLARFAPSTYRAPDDECAPVVVLQSLYIPGIRDILASSAGQLVRTHDSVEILSMASNPEAIVAALLSRGSLTSDDEATLISAAFKVDVIQLYKLAGRAAAQACAWSRAVKLLRLANVDDVDIVLEHLVRGDFTAALRLKRVICSKTEKDTSDSSGGRSGEGNRTPVPADSRGAVNRVITWERGRRRESVFETTEAVWLACEVCHELMPLIAPFPAARAAATAVTKWAAGTKHRLDIYVLAVMSAFASVTTGIHESGPDRARNLLRGDASSPMSHTEATMDSLQSCSSSPDRSGQSGAHLWKWMSTWLPCLAELRVDVVDTVDAQRDSPSSAMSPIFASFVDAIGSRVLEAITGSVTSSTTSSTQSSPRSTAFGRTPSSSSFDAYLEDEIKMLSPAELFHMQSRLLAFLYLSYHLACKGASSAAALNESQRALEAFIAENIDCLGAEWVAECCERMGNSSGVAAARVAVRGSSSQDGINFHDAAADHGAIDRVETVAAVREGTLETILSPAGDDSDMGNEGCEDGKEEGDVHRDEAVLVPSLSNNHGGDEDVVADIDAVTRVVDFVEESAKAQRVDTNDADVSTLCTKRAELRALLCRCSHEGLENELVKCVGSRSSMSRELLRLVSTLDKEGGDSDFDTQKQTLLLRTETLAALANQALDDELNFVGRPLTLSPRGTEGVEAPSEDFSDLLCNVGGPVGSVAVSFPDAVLDEGDPFMVFSCGHVVSRAHGILARQVATLEARVVCALTSRVCGDGDHGSARKKMNGLLHYIQTEYSKESGCTLPCPRCLLAAVGGVLGVKM